MSELLPVLVPPGPLPGLVTCVDGKRGGKTETTTGKDDISAREWWRTHKHTTSSRRFHLSLRDSPFLRPGLRRRRSGPAVPPTLLSGEDLFLCDSHPQSSTGPSSGAPLVVCVGKNRKFQRGTTDTPSALKDNGDWVPSQNLSLEFRFSRSRAMTGHVGR